MVRTEKIFEHLGIEVSRWQNEVSDRSATSGAEPEVLRQLLAQTFPLVNPMPIDEILDHVMDLLKNYAVHTTHPRHFGLFSPGSTPIGVIADAVAALFNPQVAAWWYAPGANAIEEHALRFLIGRLGFDPLTANSHFTSGGSEANMSGVLAALATHFPRALSSGLRVVDRQPRLYLSDQAHDSFVKIARMTGIGTDAVCRIPSDRQYKMSVAHLADAIRRDRCNGLAPFMVIATAGTTGVGAIDPLSELSHLCRAENLWFHVDAAWGGIALLSDRHRPLLSGIELADSVTWDIHKCLPVPMGAGVFVAKEKDCLSKVCSVNPAYVPAEQTGASDLYRSSILWSRRNIGLKVLMTLAELGAEGTAAQIDHHFKIADELRRKLKIAGFSIVNDDTQLPLVCFEDSNFRSATELVTKVLKSGVAWISNVRLPDGRDVARACITNHVTKSSDIDQLISVL